MREEFAIGDSSLHRLDPRLKIVAGSALSIVVAVSTRFSTLGVAMGLALILLAFARLPYGAIARHLVMVNGFVILFWIILPVSVPGTPWMHIGPIPLMREGLELAARLTIKSNAIVLAFIALVSTSSVVSLGGGMNRVRLPDKLVHLLLLTYRYLFVIQEEYERLKRAAVVRGFMPKTNLHTYRTYAYLVAIMFIRAAARANRVQQAMLCRGFQGRFYSLQEYVFTPKDWMWAAGLGLAVAIIGIIEWMPGPWS